MAYNVKKGSRYSEGTEKPLDILPLFLRYIREWLIRNELLFLCAVRKRIRDAAFFLIIMLVTFAATLLKPQNYVSSRTIQKCVEHVSTST